MILFLDNDISIYFFSNENVNYRKNYTLCYIPEVALIRSHSFIEDD